jgi:hypothetical protein
MFSQNKEKQKGKEKQSKFYVVGGYSGFNSGSYFDGNATQRQSIDAKFKRLDTLGNTKDTVDGALSLDYVEQFYTFGVKYLATEDLAFTLTMPIANRSINQKGTYIDSVQDNNGIWQTVDRKTSLNYPNSRTEIYSINLSADYKLINKEDNQLLLFGRVEIPLGGEDLRKVSEETQFLSDAYFAMNIGMSYSFALNENLGLGLGVSYFKNSEGVKDQVNSMLRLNLTKVKNFILFFEGNYRYSIGAEENYVFNPRRVLTQETYANLGAGIKFISKDDYSFDLVYLRRVYGFNTWDVGQFNLGLSVGLF